jgi:hypothetical protein
MALEHELARFDKALPQLLRTMRGQFVLIHANDAAAGPFGTEEEAYSAGCKKYGGDPFLVMLVDENEPPVPMSQDVLPHAGSEQVA